MNKKLLFIILVLVHIVGLQYVIDIKSLLFVFISFISFIFIFFDFSLKEVLFLSMLFVFSFEKGIRGWELVAVAQGNESWMHGFSLYYGLSLRSILIFTLLFLSLGDIKTFFCKKLSIKMRRVFVFLSLFLITSLISTVFSSDYFLSFFGFIRIVQAISLFLVTLAVLRRKKLQKYFFLMIVLVLFGNSLVSLQQFLAGKPLGLFLEDAAAFSSRGYVTSDGSEQLYRTTGYIGHPTFFASYMSMLVAIVLGYVVSFMKNKQSYIGKATAVLSLIAGLLAIYSTYVRSSWFTVLLVFFCFSMFAYHNYRKKLEKTNLKAYLLVLLPLFISITFFGGSLWSRFFSSINFLSEGSGVVRVMLLEEAKQMTVNNPFLGVGLNLNTRAMDAQSLLPPEILGFMFPVHNTFALFFAELGIFATVFFILFLVFLLFYSIKKAKKDPLVFGFWLAVIAFILNAQVHTLFNQDPSFDLLFMSLGVLVYVSVKEKW